MRQAITSSFDLLRTFIALLVPVIAMHGQDHLSPSKNHGTHVGNNNKYVIEGDLTIGAIFPIHNHGENGEGCGSELRNVGAVQNVEALIYGLQEVNANPSLLPGIDLGAVILDDCATPEIALGQALHFMPVKSDTSCENETHESEPFEFYDVVAVVGAESSQSSVMISHVLERFQLPIISPMSTSDVLSDKKRYPYFMRMVSPDRHQVNAILSLLQHFDWSYVSVIYSRDSYGTSAMERLQDLAEDFGVCIGYSHGLTQAPSEDVLRDITTSLLELKTKITVLFTAREELVALFRYVQDRNQNGQFVWIGSDGMGSNLFYLEDVHEAALGSLSLNVFTPKDDHFIQYFKHLTPNDTDNPWFHEMWSELYSCRFPESTNQPDLPLCSSKRRPDKLEGYKNLQAHVPLIIDTVHVIANALDNLISRKCPRARRKALRKCIRGEELLEELYKTKLYRHGINITFDDNGDSQGRYEVVNLQKDGMNQYVTERVAMWDMVHGIFEMNESEIVWPTVVDEKNWSVPISSCGRKCGPREIYSFNQMPCCWECWQCAPNEISSENSTKCTECPLYTWPDDLASNCSPIAPVHFEWHHPVVIVFAFLSLFGFAVCLTIFVIFIRNNNARLVKATSRELSYMLLGGATFQYLILLTMVAPPTSVICVFNNISFNISFTIVYSPLLTRTNRIYRIFQSGTRTKITPKLISPVSQVAIALGIIFIQIVINIIFVIITSPGSSLSMPSKSEPYVELACSVPIQCLLASLCYNVLLVFVCAYYAFKARSLPDNFNESRYITLCVYTTLVIWCAFLPTYFLSIRVFHQTILLCSALLLNASVIVLCLYMPKIYALYHGEPTITFQYNLKYSVDCPSSVPMSLQTRGKTCMGDEGISGEDISNSDSRIPSECASCRANNGNLKFSIAPL